MTRLTDEQLSEVWGVLVEECGAHDSERPGFVTHWPECNEYRFMGALGFGGKVWAGPHVRVSCYAEDVTPERRQMIDAANKRLADVEAGW